MIRVRINAFGEAEGFNGQVSAIITNHIKNAITKNYERKIRREKDSEKEMGLASTMI